MSSRANTADGQKFWFLVEVAVKSQVTNSSGNKNKYPSWQQLNEYLGKPLGKSEHWLDAGLTTDQLVQDIIQRWATGTGKLDDPWELCKLLVKTLKEKQENKNCRELISLLETLSSTTQYTRQLDAIKSFLSKDENTSGFSSKLLSGKCNYIQ